MAVGGRRHYRGDRPSVTLMVNGGSITLNDAQVSLAAGRPLIVVAGSGRSADEIARARAGQTAGEQATNIAASPLTSIVEPPTLAASLTASPAR